MKNLLSTLLFVFILLAFSCEKEIFEPMNVEEDCNAIIGPDALHKHDVIDVKLNLDSIIHQSITVDETDKMSFKVMDETF